MPLPSSHVKERLHLAYVNAVAAKAGASCTKPEQDYGVDVTIAEVREMPNGSFQNSGHMFHCQLKSTTTCEIRNENVVYDMDVEAYNKLVSWEGAGPCILVLFSLPEIEEEWLSLDEERLLLKKCCYWTHIQGPRSHNRSTQRITIPRSQRFDEKAILDLLEFVKRGMIG